MNTTIMNTITDINGEILTGKAWRRQHPFFHNLPFYSNIPRLDDMAGPLEKSLSEAADHKSFSALLVKLARGLDDVHPFSDTEEVDIIIREAHNFLSPDSPSIGRKNASRIWGFMSKFVMVDRFAKTLGGAALCPGLPIPKKTMATDDFGGALKLLDEINPPTKILRKFLKTWGDRNQSRSEYSAQLPASNDIQEPASVALTLSRRLIAVVKFKKVLNIEAGVEMIALGTTIASENSGVFPESINDFNSVLRRIWLNRLDEQQFEEILIEMLSLHKSMKYIMEGVFAISPLLALTTSGWSRGIQGAYLLRVFIALGNDRPEIIIRVEDEVLKAIVGISEGRPRGELMDVLHAQIGALEQELAKDEHALDWFDFTTTASSISSTPPPAEARPTPMPAIPILQAKFKGGLASPPESPHVPFPSSSSSSALPSGRISSPQLVVNPSDRSDREDGMDSGVHELPEGETHSHQLVNPSEPESSPFALPLGQVSSSQFVTPSDPDESSALPLEPSSSQSVNPSKPDDMMDSSNAAELGRGESHQLTVDRVSHLGDVVPELNLGPRPRKSSIVSSLTDIAEMEIDGQPTPGVESAEESGSETMAGVESHSENEEDESEAEKEEEQSDSENEEDDSMNGVVEDGDEATMEPTLAEESCHQKTTNHMSVDSALASQLATVGLRRSSRTKQTLQVVPAVPLRTVAVRPLPLPTVVVVRKPVAKKNRIVVLESLEEGDEAKLSEVKPATFHPTMFADIAGWGSTVEAGPKPYRHVPVQIVRPGRVASTGDDTDTLRKVETLIQADFRDGLPPHLQANASSLKYVPGSDQSRIFVSSHSDFSRLEAADIQGLLRQRVILVHGHPFDYNYGWDLPSLGRVYDVDKKVSVLVSSLIHPHHPDLRHRQGTLRQFHKMSIHQSTEQFPPLNALSLPGNRRNLVLPCQFGSLASHEVAQTRLPSAYEMTFAIPELKSQLEWSIVGGKGAISPFHVDSDGLGTVVLVLEGSKYWVLATRLGDKDTISTVDSLGPDWEPYRVNDGNNINCFRFEGVHLQQGDMLIIPPGVPHWVLSTSNAICVGRHFYASSTIRLSILGIVHGFFLAGSLTNEDHLETRTLLYQLLVFWSMRIDQTDVDGAHIPQLGCEEQFFDLVYLGIFVILSPAFDRRFYSKPPAALLNEVAYAIQSFRALIHLFARRFVIFLGVTAVAVSYVVDRILAEFAAAAVVFASRTEPPFGEGNDRSAARISFPQFLQTIRGILEQHSPDILPFFSGRVESDHKDFLWIGPDLKIFPRTKDITKVIPLTGDVEAMDFPSCLIYSQAPAAFVRKRDRPEDGMDVEDDEQPKKKKC